MIFDEETVQKVWEKGKIVENHDPKEWRKDECDAWIKRDLYRNRFSEWGWEIDHIDADGGDELSNLRPLQWDNALLKAKAG